MSQVAGGFRPTCCSWSFADKKGTASFYWAKFPTELSFHKPLNLVLSLNFACAFQHFREFATARVTRICSIMATLLFLVFAVMSRTVVHKLVCCASSSI